MQSYAISDPQRQSLYLSIGSQFGYKYLTVKLTPEQYKEIYEFNTKI
jgi:hypothetical protein